MAYTERTLNIHFKGDDGVSSQMRRRILETMRTQAEVAIISIDRYTLNGGFEEMVIRCHEPRGGE